ncbi:MAG TPA: hypothetical protein P5186_07910 [Candidatus Paceibacterota bacterium]|nr:hypothetical protein [Candidatus Paceibacterota bacterium]
MTRSQTFVVSGRVPVIKRLRDGELLFYRVHLQVYLAADGLANQTVFPT